MERSIKINRLIIILVFALSFFLLFWKLGENKLTNWDEAWYGAVSREMSISGNFITPKWNNAGFF